MSNKLFDPIGTEGSKDKPKKLFESLPSGSYSTQNNPLTVGQSQYDKNLVYGEDVNINRAQNQPWYDEAANAVVQTVAGVPLGIAEGIGYLAELGGYGYDEAMGNKYTTDFDNALTSIASGMREDLTEEFEIYRKDPNAVFDFRDSAWWMQHGQGLVESIGEFYSLGSGMASASGRVAGMLTRRLGSTAGRLSQAAGQIGTSTALAYTEGAISASQVYKDVLEASGSKEKAAIAAAKTAKINTALVSMLNMTSVAPLFQSNHAMNKVAKFGLSRKRYESNSDYLRRLRESLDDPDITPSAANKIAMMLREAGQEGLEEQVNMFAEGEGKIEGGLAPNTGTLTDRFFKGALSEEGILNFALGALGGIGQKTAVDHIPFYRGENGKRISASRAADEDKKKVYNMYRQQIIDDLVEMQDAQDRLREAAENISDDRESVRNIKIREARNDLFSLGVGRSLVNGLGESYAQQFDDIAAVDNTTEDENGMTEAMKAGLATSKEDNEYKQVATERSKAIKNLSKKFEKINSRFNKNTEAAVREQLMNLNIHSENIKSDINYYNRQIDEIRRDTAELEQYSPSRDVRKGMELSTLVYKEAIEDLKNKIDSVDGRKRQYRKKGISKKSIREEIKRLNDRLKEYEKIENDSIKAYQEANGIESFEEAKEQMNRNLDEYAVANDEMEKDYTIRKVQAEEQLRTVANLIKQVENNPDVRNDIIEKFNKRVEEENKKFEKQEELKKGAKEGTESPKTGEFVMHEGNLYPLEGKVGNQYIRPEKDTKIFINPDDFKKVETADDQRDYLIRKQVAQEEASKKSEPKKENPQQEVKPEAAPKETTSEQPKPEGDFNQTPEMSKDSGIFDKVEEREEDNSGETRLARIDQYSHNGKFKDYNDFLYENNDKAVGVNVRLEWEKDNTYSKKAIKATIVMGGEDQGYTYIPEDSPNHASLLKKVKESPQMTKITEVGTYALIGEDYREDKNNVFDYYENIDQPLKLAYGSSKGIRYFNPDGSYTPLSYKDTTKPNNGRPVAGEIFMVIKDPKGIERPVMLQRQNIDEVHKDIVKDIYDRLLKSTKENDFTFNSDYEYSIEGTPLISGLKVREVLRLLVNEGERSVKTNYPLAFMKATETTPAYILYGEGKRTTNPLLDKDFDEFLNSKKYNGIARLLNRNLIGDSADTSFISDGRESFIFNGNTYDRNSKYEDILFNRVFPMFTTDMPFDKEPFVSPIVKISNDLSPVKLAKKQESAPKSDIDTTQFSEENDLDAVFGGVDFDDIELPDNIDDIVSGKTSKPNPTDKPKDDKKDDDEDNDIDGEDLGLFREATTEGRPFDLTEEIKWLKNNVNIPVQLVDDLIRIGNDKGGYAFGAFKNGVITLSKINVPGTTYHEAFHAVSQLYLNDKERSSLYNQVRKHHGRKMTDLEAEETLAEDFRTYVMSEGKVEKYATKGFFAKIWEWIKNLFSNAPSVNRLFRQINSGYFKDYKPLDDRTAKFTDEYLYARIGDFSADEVDAVTNLMVAAEIRQAKRSGLTELSDLSKLDTGFKTSYSVLRNAMKGKHGMPERKEYLAQLYKKVTEDHWEEIKAIAKRKLYSYGIKEKEDRGSAEDISGAIKSHFETSMKDNATANVKMLMASITKTTFNPITGMYDLVDFNQFWNALKQDLSGIVDENDGFKTGFDKMVDRLQAMSKYRPEYNQIIKEITSFPLYKKAQFFVSMSGVKNNFTSAFIEETETGINYNVVDPDVLKREAQFRKGWLQNFKKKYPDLNKNKLKSLLSSAQKLRALQRMPQAKIMEDGISDIVDVLKDTGIEVSPMSVAWTINNSYNGNPKDFINNLMIIYESPSGTSDDSYSIERIVEDYEYAEGYEFNFLRNHFFNESVVSQLAEGAAYVDPNPAEPMVYGSDNNPYYIFGVNNYLNKAVTEIKSSPDVIEEITDSTFHKRSYWGRILPQINTNKKSFNVAVFNTAKIVSKSGDYGTKYDKLAPIDELAARVNLLLNVNRPFYSLPTTADKPTWYLLQGSKSMFVNSGVDANFNVSEKVVDIFEGYFLDEYERIREAYDTIDELPDSELVEHYHYKASSYDRYDSSSMRKRDGNAFKLSDIFKGIDKSIVFYEGAKKGQPYPIGADGFIEAGTKTDLIRTHVRDYIRNSISNRIKNAFQQIDFDLIDSKIKTGYVTANNEMADMRIAGDFVVNSMIATFETYKLFSGDPAFYKNLNDLKKRMPELIAPGLDLYLDHGGTEEQNFKVSVLETKNIDVSKEVYDSLKELGFDEKRAKELSKAYAKSDTTDAQAYISLKRYKFLKERLGQWHANDDILYERLERGEGSSYDVQLMIQPLKGMYYSLRPSADGRRMIPTYLKYSQAVLFKQITPKGSELDRIREVMEDEKGIDEVVYDTGVKVGITGKGSIETTIPFTLENRFWKQQQIVDPKKKNATMIGSQIKKNVIANIDQTGSYTIGDQEVMGFELINKFNEIEIERSTRAKNQLVEDFGAEYNEAENVYVINDFSKFRDMILKEITRRMAPDVQHDVLEAYDDDIADAPALTDEIVKLLELRNGKFIIPMDTTGFRKSLQSMIHAMITKRIVKVQMPGGSYVQMSGASIKSEVSKDVENGIWWFNEDAKKNGLKPPRIEDGKLKGGQILVPQRMLKKLLPERDRKQGPTWIKNLIDPSALQAIGYRIPNQGMSSNDYLEIVGVLPDSAGDTVMVYDGITTKTGSDFDIDKMYLMFPSLEFENLRVRATPYTSGDLSELNESQLINYQFDTYKAILTDTKTYEELITPLDSEGLMLNANSMAKYTGKDDQSITAMEYVDPLYNMKVKQIFHEAKGLVGIFANHLVDHAISYNLKIRGINFNSRKDDKGRLITNNISAYMNGAVDAAKDPYLSRTNVNDVTADIAMMFIRAGKSYEWVNAFMAQPFMVDFANSVKESRSKLKPQPNKALSNLKKQVIKMVKDGDFPDPNRVILNLEQGSIEEALGLTSFDLNEADLMNRLETKSDDLVLMADFAFRLNDVRKILSDQMMASKSDVNGAHNSRLASQIALNKIADIRAMRYQIQGFDEKFDNTILGNATAVNEFAINLYANETLESSPVFDKALSEIYRNKMGVVNMTDEEFATKINDEIYTAIISTAFNNTSNLKNMFYGDKTLAHVIKEYKDKMGEEGYPHNKFIEYLEPVISYEENVPSWVESPSLLKKDAAYINSLTYAFEDLYDTHPNLAKALVSYSAITTGGRKTMNSFFDMIPASFFAEPSFNYLNRIAKFKKEMNNPQSILKDVIVDQVVRHNLDFAKNMVFKGFKYIKDTTKVYAVNNKGIPLAFGLTSIKADELGINHGNENKPIFAKYITFSTKANDYLYKLDGMDGENAVYRMKSLMGMKDYAGHRITEYDLDTPTKGTVLPYISTLPSTFTDEMNGNAKTEARELPSYDHRQLNKEIIDLIRGCKR